MASDISEMERYFKQKTKHEIRYRNSKTYSGINIHRFKSGIQKYIRRGNPKILDASKEIIATRFGVCKSNDGILKGSEKAMFTNLCNRLRVCAIEDGSQRCVKDVNFILQSIDKWDNNPISNWKCLYEACVILRRIKKCRVNSHLKYICHPKAENKEILSNGSDFRKNVINQMRLSQAYYLCDLYNKYIGGNVHDSSIDNQKSVRKLAPKRKYFAGYWKTLQDCCKKMKDPADLLENITLKRKFFEKRKWFKEELLVLLSAYESYIACEYSLCIPSILDEEKESYQQEVELENDWFKKYGRLDMDEEYIDDMHVNRPVDKSVTFFVNEGAKVTNEDNDWCLPSLHKQYDSIKIKCENENKNMIRYGNILSNSDGIGKKINNKRKYSSIDHEVHGNIRDNIEVSTLSKRKKSEKQKDRLEKVKTNLGLEYKNFLDFKVCCVCRRKSHKGFSTIVHDCSIDTYRFVKEMNISFNFGVDQLICHEAKRKNLLRLPNLSVPGNVTGELLYSDYVFKDDVYVKKSELTDDSIHHKPCLYFCCGAVNSKRGDWNVRCSHNPKTRQEYVNTESGYSSLLSILIFRSVFGVNDTNYSNIIFDDEKHVFYSVDENYIGTITPKVFWAVGNSKTMQIRRELENSILDNRMKRDCFPVWIKNPNRDELLLIKKDIYDYISKYYDLLIPSHVSNVMDNFEECFKIVSDMYDKLRD